MFIDTHCHLSMLDYDDIDEIVENNISNNISIMIVSGCSKDSIYESLELSKKYKIVYLTLGYHPSEASTTTKEDLDELKKLLMNDKVVGVGEIGLDYHYGKEDRDKQIELFEEQLKIADELFLPVVIHSRDATLDTIEILKKHSAKGVIHCFSGSIETALQYVKMGFKLGIGGVVTFKNSKLYEVVKAVGLDNIVLETDSPYLTPEPYRGQKNSSKYIPIIAKKIADICDTDVDNVATITTNNARSVYDIK